MNLLEAQDWTFPVPIAYGPGRLKDIAALCQSVGISTPLVVTDHGSRDLPFMKVIETCLNTAGINHAVFSGISPNPRDDEIWLGRSVYGKGGHDGIIAVGGGSGMDGGKAICSVANNNIDLWDFDYARTPPDMRQEAAFPPLICIPSTAGTGAETESTAMVTDVSKGMKFCTWHPELKPAVALLDPEITLGLPPDMTAWTGCDALVHAIEAYCVPSFHPICDGVALEALRLTSVWLPVVARQPDNIEARGGMLVGSCLAGISFLKGLGLVHAISHMVGAEYDTHHGLTNAVILPSVLKFNAPTIRDRIPVMAQAMGLEQSTEAAFHDAIVQLLDDLNIPVTLQEIGVPGDCAERIAQKSVQDMVAETNPRQASVAEVRSIIEHALFVGRHG